MKKKLIIITKNVFTQYDYDRFKIHELKKNFNIFCIDCSSLFFKNIKKNKNTSFVDLIKSCLKKKIRVGVYPVPDIAWKDFGRYSEFNINTNF